MTQDLTKLSEKQLSVAEKFKQHVIASRIVDLQKAINAEIEFNPNHIDGEAIGILRAQTAYQWHVEDAREKLKYAQELSLEEYHKILEARK
jgi:hypothetical protein